MRFRDAEASEIRVAAKDFHVVGRQVTWEGVCIGRVYVCVWKVMCSVLLKCNLTLTHTLLEVSTLMHRCDCHHGYKTS